MFNSCIDLKFGHLIWKSARILPSDGVVRGLKLSENPDRCYPVDQLGLFCTQKEPKNMG